MRSATAAWTAGGVMALGLAVAFSPAGPAARGADRAPGGGAVVVDFETAEAGKLPDGFAAARSGVGKEGTWVVREEAGAPSGKRVLAQTDPDKTNSRFPLCVYQKVKAKDVTVSVAFKAVSGNVDKAAGVMVRYRDAGHYYIARANAEEGNVRFYRFEKGERSKHLKTVDVDVPAQKWQTLTLSAKGNHFTVSLDGKVLFEVDDDTYKEAGLVGVWTKADSVTCFDDLKIEVADR